VRLVADGEIKYQINRHDAFVTPSSQLGQITTPEVCDHFTQDFSHFSRTHLNPYDNRKQEKILHIYQDTSWFLEKNCVDNHFVELVDQHTFSGGRVIPT